ncbi:hypothetical protein KHS38_05400 [Mucilaginibacter sp. Bleaf8]|uniref:hypothetical protein n=1 Tax=Mucilaginibacter sp. Bleaf8 TaxID=2834430 RepID=UPI001BCAF1BC|nr:hypothetical protein [Mucilaginibacter sp. Bleaf8]MBS7563832.1 hypothetical protein [Mucilaginibacter sp. Bleaf8]
MKDNNIQENKESGSKKAWKKPVVELISIQSGFELSNQEANFDPIEDRLSYQYYAS